jgi:hypothetical protein
MVEDRSAEDRSADVGVARTGDAAAPAPWARVPPGLVFRWAATGTFGVLVVLVAGYGLYVVRSVLVLVAIALFLAVSACSGPAPLREAAPERSAGTVPTVPHRRQRSASPARQPTRVLATASVLRRGRRPRRPTDRR